MALPTLYNFHQFDLPDGVQELLDLLNFYTLWDGNRCRFQIYEKVGFTRMKWKAMSFPGGTTADWQRFLSSITSSEHLR